jgi:protein O-GlcNAc transferase
LELEPDFVEALTQRIHLQQHICDWDDLSQSISRVTTTAAWDNGRVPPFILLAIPATPAQQLSCAQRWSSAFEIPHSPFKFVRENKPYLTIGYLSADLRDHPVGNLAVELFECHSRDNFRVNAYSFGPDDGSSLRQRLVHAFDQFVEVSSLSFAQTAQKIYDDGVDILVDLMGHTRRARTQVMALRPAPIQVNFLGYPSTMGASFMDYIIVDDFVAPPSQQPYFTEQLVHLPGSYLPNDSRRSISERTPSRAECGLPNDGFVFCSFNQPYKISPQVLDVWSHLLAAVPNSVLWLPNYNRIAAANLTREFESRGLERKRVVFAPRLAQLPDHLARLRCADLFLDTWPYNAHTTASDALPCADLRRSDVRLPCSWQFAQNPGVARVDHGHANTI